jgi:hypothetical protein
LFVRVKPFGADAPGQKRAKEEKEAWKWWITSGTEIQRCLLA